MGHHSPSSPNLSGPAGPTPPPARWRPYPRRTNADTGPRGWDRFVPWSASVLLHAAVGLTVLLVVAVLAVRSPKKVEPMTIAQGWRQHFILHPKRSIAPRHARRQAQQNLQRYFRRYVKSTAAALPALLNRATPQPLAFIAHGTGAGSAAPALQIPLAELSRPPTRFIQQGGNAARLVYIIQHSGGMLYHFGRLKRGLTASIHALNPLQSFAIIVFVARWRFLVAPRLIPATNPNKRKVLRALETVAPAGDVSGLLQPFVRPFRAALRLHPQIIYFLTNGSFDPRLLAIVRRLNRFHTVIFTYDFMNGNPVLQSRLRKLASENGGRYKYVSR